MSQRQDAFDELTEMRRKAQMEKTRLVEVKTKGTDPLVSYSKEMPNALLDGRHFGFGLLVDSVTEPASPDLAIESILWTFHHEVYMSRHLALAEVLHDQEHGADYKAVSTRDPRILDAFTRVDTSEMEAENE